MYWTMKTGYDIIRTYIQELTLCNTNPRYHSFASSVHVQTRTLYSEQVIFYEVLSLRSVPHLLRLCCENLVVIARDEDVGLIVNTY